MRSLATRLAALLLLSALALALTGGALGFCAAALYLGLESVLSPPVAALLTAAVLLAAGLIALAAAALIARRPAARPTAAAAASDLGGLAAEVIAPRARRLWQAHALDALVLAFAGGLILGLSPRLRRALLRALRQR